MAAQLQQSDNGEFGDTARSISSNTMKRILLVDNQAHVLRVLKLSLDRNGYEVDTALNASVALRMMRETKYDAVVAENVMAEMPGQKLLDTIVEQFSSESPALFLLTENNDRALQDWACAQQQSECLQKPISLQYLVGRLNELFGKYNSDQAI